MAARGIQDVPLRVPDDWDPVWFAAFVRDVLAKADVRNAIQGSGISITGQSNDLATISSSEDLQQLKDQGYVLADPPTDPGLIPNSRQLAGEPGVVTINDEGAGGNISVTIEAHGLSYSKLRLAAPLSVLGNPDTGSAEIVGITGVDDTVLRRTAGALNFGTLTLAMANNHLWTYAKIQAITTTKRTLARKTAGSGDIEECTTSELLDFIGTPANGDVLYRVSGAWAGRPVAANGKIFTVVSGLPDWADPPSPLTSKGDIYTHNGTIGVRLAVGADTTILVANSATATGLEWQPLISEQLLYGSVSTPAGNTVANTVTETTFAVAYSLPANKVSGTGTVIRGKITGIYGTTGTPTLRLRLKIGGTTVLDTTAFTTASGLTNRGWTLEYQFHVQAIGSSGTAEIQGEARFSTAAITASVALLANTAVVSIDWTTAQAIEVTAQWGTANAANTITMRQYAVYMATAQPVGGDPFFANVVLLMGFEGVDTAVTAPDESTYGRTLTFNGNAQIDTAQFKAGAASLLLDGTGDFVTAPTSSDLSVATGNFTIEAWIRLGAGFATHTNTISNKREATSAQEHSFGINTSGQVFAQAFNAGSAVLSITGTTGLTTGAFHHVAVTRSGTTWRVFIDGVQEATAVQSGAPSTSTSVFRVGRDGFATNRDFEGWIDEFRFTKGVARYTANFTPDAVFPRS